MSAHAALGPAGDAAQASLTRLAAVAASATLWWTGGWLLVAPPESMGATWWPLVVAAWSLAAVSLAAPLWWQTRIFAAAPFTALLIMTTLLIDTKSSSGLVGSWLQLELVAVAAAVAAMALPSLRITVLADSAVVGLVAATAFQGVSPELLSATPLAGLTVTARVLLFATTLAIAAHLLRRSAATSDRILAAYQADEVSAATQAWLTQRDDQVRRFLHDSGLNTLEAVSRGVSGDLSDQLRHRCATDVRRWLTFATPAPPDVAAAFEPALAEAQLRGVTVAVSYDSPSAAPAQVLAAMSDACAEALRNAAKHAHCSEARVVVHSSTASVLVEVRDDGSGFDTGTRAAGLGLDLSIRKRLSEVGGIADITSRPGGGTTVRMTWPAPDACAAGDGDAIPDAADRPSPGESLPEQLSSLAAIPMLVMVVTSVLGTAANWSSTSIPWLYAISGVVIVGVCGWFLHRYRARRLTSADLALVFTTLLLVPLLQPLADPFCAAATSSALIPDGRLVLLAMVGVFLAQWRWSAGALLVSIVAMVAAGWMWWNTWPSCAATTIPALFTLVLTGLASTMFGRAVRRQETAAMRAHRAESNRRLNEARLRTDTLVRQQWALPAARQARDTLASIAAGREVNEPGLAREAARRAARLRCALQIRDLPDPLAAQFAELVNVGTEEDLAVSMRGSPRDVQAPLGLLTALTSDLAAWRVGLVAAQVTGLSVTLAHSRDWQSILIQAAIATETGRYEEITTRRINPPGAVPDAAPGGAVAATAATVTCWSDEEGLWWHAEWSVLTSA
jgi:signal transduction histidine kinase